MADCHDLFREFLGEIRLSESKKASLRTSRNANRERIRDHFRDALKKEVPKFHGQGSYNMHTMVNPLDDDYDIDDGVYLQSLGTDQSKWPSCATVHGWIIDATKGYTKTAPASRSKCVRVPYVGYHVDLPCYALNLANVPMLFRKGKDPIESDPREFSKWFKDNVKAHGDQLRDHIRYLKGWRDHQGGDALLASGCALTILASNHFIADGRDDVSLVKTVSLIHSYMAAGGKITKPVTPYENLDGAWTQRQRENYIKKLKNFVDRGNDALAEESKAVASGIWRQLLGNRFPVVEEEEKSNKAYAGSALRTSAPAILGNDGRSG
jgi:cyclic GMP-AMP synthase DncV-like protein